MMPATAQRSSGVLNCGPEKTAMQRFLGSWSRGALVCALLGLAGAATATEPAEPIFCDQGGDDLCAHLPHDVPRFFATFNYRFLTPKAQDPFDLFSWQSFVALNWPADDRGRPLAEPIGSTPAAPRRWQFFVPPPNAASPVECRGTRPGGPVVTATYRQATGEVLVDRDLNYVVYDTRVNRAATGPVADHMAGRLATPVAFPDGHYADLPSRSGGPDGAAILKTAWRVLDPGRAGRYLTVPGRVAVAAADSIDGRARCHMVTLGLVGMHIMRKVRSGNGDEWIWSTFEHADNAPVAANARGANSTVTFDPFPTGCHAPPTSGYAWSFFTRCENCTPNQPSTGDAPWAADPPFARHHEAGASQVVRCWRLFEGTAQINRQWRAKLAGTVFANYQLVGTQWRGNNGGPLAGVGEVPRYLTNTSLESYIQAAPQGSCLTCHSTARTPAGDKADFTFLLSK